MSKENSMGEKITLCPGCNCMTHTATLNKCGKCGATKPTAPETDEGEDTWLMFCDGCDMYDTCRIRTTPRMDDTTKYPCPFKIPDLKPTAPADIDKANDLEMYRDDYVKKLQAALNDAHTDSRQQKDRVERLVEGSKEKDKRIEELEGKVPYPHLPKLQPVNYTKSILDGWEKAEAKLLSAEAVVEAAREYTARLKVAIDDGVTRESEEELEEPSDTFEAALSAHDNQIEEGLSE